MGHFSLIPFVFSLCNNVCTGSIGAVLSACLICSWELLKLYNGLVQLIPCTEGKLCDSKVIADRQLCVYVYMCGCGVCV